jgi:hypothetical protein
MQKQKGGSASATTLDLGSAPTSSGKALYRDDKPAKSNNIMYDKRVVRGSTYAMPVIPPVRNYLPCPNQQTILLDQLTILFILHSFSFFNVVCCNDSRA